MAIDLGLTIIDSIMHNCMIKTYPDGSREITAAPVALFREPGWELSDDYEAHEERRRAARRRQRWDEWETIFGGDLGTAEDAAAREAESVARSKRRARTMVRDYARSNDFTFFVTLTLDGGKVDRYDIDAVTKIMRTWLDNRVRRKGLKYILVPELHKDGAVHFHGFFNDALPALDSGTLSKGGKPRKPRSKAARERMLSEGWHVVYNLPDWTLGFTTAVQLYGNRDAAISYVCKYVTKSQTKVGGRWYYSGGALALPEISHCDVDYAAVAAEHCNSEFTIDNLKINMVRYFQRSGSDEVSE